MSDTAVVVNTRTFSVVEYSNFAFNSFCDIGGRSFASNGINIVELVGETDNGTPINATFTTGVTQLGTDVFKRIPEAYVQYRPNGDMKLFTVTEETITREYDLKYNGKKGVHERRVKFNEGVKAGSWAFGAKNVNGADFDLQKYQVMFRPLDRMAR